MNLKELTEKLEDITIEIGDNIVDLYEMARNRKDMKHTIQSLGDNVTDHLCKILYLKALMPETVHHWCAEILAPLEWIIKRDLKGGKLTVKALTEWLDGDLISQSQMTIRRRLIAKYENVPLDKLKPIENNDYETIHKQTIKLAELVITCIKNKDIITIEDIENIVK